MSVGSYVAAASVDEAVAAMAAGARPVAGGTDLVVGARQGKKPLPKDWLKQISILTLQWRS